MKNPAFFDQAPTITVLDPLARFLGAAEEGIIEYRYRDAVKLAGHSCPTVAGAYLMTRRALRALYPDTLPVRGEIAVAFRGGMEGGTTGVMGTVAGLITGAAGSWGFQGLGGRFRRRGLLTFGADIDRDARFTRLDTGAAVGVTLHLDRAPADPKCSIS